MPVINRHVSNPGVNAIDITRGSLFGNPYVIGVNGDRSTVLRRFETLVRERIVHEPEFRAAVKALHLRTLVCVCKPKPCHGDILLRIAAELQSSK